MQDYQRKLSKDVQRGLMSILVKATVPYGDEPYTVLTNSPGAWLAYSGTDSIILLDLTGLIGTSPWNSEQDLRDRLVEQMVSAGWSNKQIAFEHAGPSLVKDPQTFQVRPFADVVVFDSEGKAIAVGEVKRSGRSSNLSGIEQSKFLAKAFGARFAFSWQGDEFLILDFKDQSVREMTRFPAPADLGTSVPESQESRTHSKQRIEIIRCETIQTLVGAISKSSNQNILIDYTMPFGMLNSHLIEGMMEVLPLVPRDLRQIDFLAALILLVGTQLPTARLSAIVPLSFLWTSSFQAVRNALQESLGIAGIAELPPGTLAPIAMLPLGLIVLGKTRNDGNVVFARASTRGDIIEPESQPWFHSFINGLAGQEMQSGFLATVPREQPWSPSRYRPEVRLAEAKLAQVFSSQPLAELFEVIQGHRHQREEDSHGEPFVRGRDLGANVFLDKAQLAKFRSERPIPQRARILSGDVLLQRIGARPQSIVAGAELEGSTAGDTVVILRPNSGLADSALLVQFLRSTIGQDLLLSRALTATAPTLRLSGLRSLPIPILSGDIPSDLDELQTIEQDLRTRADKLASMRLQLFSADSSEDLSLRLKDIRQSALAIEASIQQAETAEFQIRNFYPFPLAYPYRTLASPTVLQERYKEQLRVAENILAFLGSVSLALVDSSHHASLDDTLKQAWQGGISPGHWRDISQKTGKLFETDQNNKLALSLASLWRPQGRNRFPKNIEKLIKAKNDFKHDRGPRIEEDYEEATKEVEVLVDEVMSELSFLTEYPIRLITDLDGVRGSRRVVVQTLRFVGDHPGLIQERLEYPETLTKGDLYIQIQEGNWKSLFPFLSAHNCPHCKYRETYFIDRWNRAGGMTILKSFERGHTTEDNETASSLSNWIS